MVTKVLQSGFQNIDSLPYVTLAKVSCALDTRDTCANRIERHIFQLSAFDDDYSNLKSVLKKLHEIYDYRALQIGNRRFLSMHFIDERIEEPEPGLYQGFLQHEVLVQKDFSPSIFNTTISGNLFETLLTNSVKNVSTTRFAKETWEKPFVYIPNYHTVEDFVTTLTRIDRVGFEIFVEDYIPDDIEIVLEEIDNTLSYRKIQVDSGKLFTNLEWLGDTLEEIEPGYWRGSLQYDLMIEDEIT